MIGSLSGNVSHIMGDIGIVNVNGVGYEVQFSSGVLSKQPAVGKKIDLVIYTDVKETSLVLFGFVSFIEREVFLLLKKAKGVGSKTALNIISTLGPEAVLSAIGQGMVSRLSQVSGVGRKTAERIIVELREKVTDLIETPRSSSAVSQVGSSLKTTLRATLRDSIEVTPIQEQQLGAGAFRPSSFTDAVLALEKLGFPADRANSAVNNALNAIGTEESRNIDAGNLLREALSRL